MLERLPRPTFQVRTLKQRKGKTVRGLDPVRAATEDAASARAPLQERTEALDATIQTALDHGIPRTRSQWPANPCCPTSHSMGGSRTHERVA